MNSVTLTTITVGALFFLTACEEVPQEPSGEKSQRPPVDAQNQLQAQGCTATKSRGRLSITCADGSSASFGASAYHIKDGGGVEFTNMLFIGNYGAVAPTLLNQDSGNVLSYGVTGDITKITRTFYAAANCVGTAYAYPPDTVIKNKVMLNDGAWPGGSPALRIIGYEKNALPFVSKFEAGACVPAAGSGAGAAIVAATTFGATDPMSITLPLEVVSQ